jgi:hypothetical protein
VLLSEFTNIVLIEIVHVQVYKSQRSLQIDWHNSVPSSEFSNVNWFRITIILKSSGMLGRWVSSSRRFEGSWCLLQNAGDYTLIDTAWYARRPESSATPLRELQILQVTFRVIFHGCKAWFFTIHKAYMKAKCWDEYLALGGKKIDVIWGCRKSQNETRRNVYPASHKIYRVWTKENRMAGHATHAGDKK